MKTSLHWLDITPEDIVSSKKKKPIKHKRYVNLKEQIKTQASILNDKEKRKLEEETKKIIKRKNKMLMERIKEIEISQ